jgi:DNA repair protein RadC
MPSFALRELPLELRPRERLERHGVDALNLAELIAIVLGSGTQGKSVLSLSEELVVRFSSLERLIDASIVELMEIKGIGRAKAIQLQAVFCIARKYKQIAIHDKHTIAAPEHAYAIAKNEIAQEKQEVLMVILRDVRGCLIHQEAVSKGTLSEILVHPREVFYPAVRYKAHSLILAHNHPSGDPSPSEADLALTRCLLHAGRTMGIALDDHLIVCPHSYISLCERGYIPARARY